MKKLLALALALTMTFVIASAATPDYKPGDKILIDSADQTTVVVWDKTGGATEPKFALNKDNYSITSSSWSKGKDLVSSVSFDNDEDKLVIKLRNDYKNYKEKALEGTIKVRERKAASGATTTATHTVKITALIGYAQGTISVDADHIADLIGDIEDNIFKVVEAGSTYGTLEFDTKDVSVTGRVYKDEIFYFGTSVVPAKDILTANADNYSDPDIINFVGNPTFVSAATVRFYADRDTYIYEYKDGKLTRLNTTWRSDEEAHEIKTRTLGYYVLSAEPLKNAAAANTTTPGNTVTNPNTGANDIAGVATALAAVTLMSAAAISLKKKEF